MRRRDGSRNRSYGSVRIDAVHYCELEEILQEKRNRKSTFGRKDDTADIPTLRLQLFQRTVRANPILASQVRILKLAYMTRETAKSELARTVSVLPNLQYVDLPDGFYGGDPSCHGLKQELQARCPDIRKMTYSAGSEPSFELLAYKHHWMSLEKLELSNLAIEPVTVRHVLGILPVLHELKISNVKALDDGLFAHNRMLPHFPPLHKLIINEQPRITAAGLVDYLSRPAAREVLGALTLQNTGVTVPELHKVVWEATHIASVSYAESVVHPLPLEPIQPLTSLTLKVLAFEITTSANAPNSSFQKPTDSYYSYLIQSLHSGSLPALSHLYVRDPEFPDNLLLTPPTAPFAVQNSTGFNQPLEVYTKGLDELDWIFTSIAPMPENGHSHRRGSSFSRPVSAYSASKGLGPQWGGEARKSVIVGNGFGGFLAVPADDDESFSSVRSRSGSSGAWSKASRISKHISGKGSVSSTASPSKDSLAVRGHDRKGSRHDLWR